MCRFYCIAQAIIFYFLTMHLYPCDSVMGDCFITSYFKCKLSFYFLFILFIYLFILVFLPFLGPLPQHMEVSRLGVESELKPPAYARAIATQDPNRVCNLHHSSRHHWILNPLSKAKDRTCNLMVLSRIR